MENYYKVLGISSAATADEIRRAYKVLARRYHPDVNPEKASEDRFKKIAAAYQILGDAEKRRQYDAEMDRIQGHASATARGFSAYEEALKRRAATENKRATAEKKRSAPAKEPLEEEKSTPWSHLDRMASTIRGFDLRSEIGKFFRDRKGKGRSPAKEREKNISQISIIEVSISIFDAIKGIKKTVEIPDGRGQKKLSVTIPPGVRTGSVVRFNPSPKSTEEIVLITRVAQHPFLSMAQKGLVIEVPITVKEAISGARFQVPTLDEPAVITVEPGSQSGTEIRLKERGVTFRDGSKGDLFIRLMIRVPDAHQAVGLKEKAAEIEAYQGEPVRRHMPRSLMDGV